MVTVLIPTPLRQYAGGQDSVEVSGRNVGEVLATLVSKHEALKRHLYNEQGKLRNFVNIYLNDEDIRHLQGETTSVKDGDTMMIVPSIAGGSLKLAPQQATFTRDEIRRYSRHLIMPEIGMEGQRKLKTSSVLLIGAGGLGSPLGLYLAAAGVGRMGVVDFDKVEYSNLQRQIVYSVNDVGRPKLEAYEERLHEINPHVKVETHNTRLTSENALSILKDYDIVIDGTDNYQTRYLVNDACVLLEKPNVYGSIFRFEGQVSVFDAKKGPCYRCLYPEPPPPGLVPSCAEGGVLGVLPGIIGTMQATEAVKLIIGKGTPLVGRLLLFDALKMKFKELKLRKDKDCPICGEDRTITNLIDYDEFCGVRGETGLDAEWEVTPEELKKELDAGEPMCILDVREPFEYEICKLDGAKLIPLGELPERANELNTADKIAAYCHTGSRSAQAVMFLRQLGFRKVKNLKGGINAWATKVDPSIPSY